MENYITRSGLNLKYQKNGSGSKNVIIMHGWGCRATTMALFEQTILRNCPDTTVYNLDLPGFGDSDEPEKVYGIEDYTRTVEEFARDLNIERPILIGHSFGGRIAILFASRNDVRQVILVDAAGVKPRRSLRYYLKVYSFKLSKRMLPLLVGKKRAGEIIERRRKGSGSSDYANATPRMRAILSKVVNEDLRGVMPHIKAPTLLIWGENDTATPMRDARIMEKLIPDAGLVSYPGCGHYSFLDNPAQTSAVVTAFINGKQ